MNKIFTTAILAACFALTACGKGADCNTPEVLDTLRTVVSESVSDSKADARLAKFLKVITVVTESVDKDVNAYECRGTLVYTAENASEAKIDIEYTVHQVHSKDADFEVTYDPDLLQEMGRSIDRLERPSAATTAEVTPPATQVAPAQPSANPGIVTFADIMRYAEASPDVQERMVSDCADSRAPKSADVGAYREYELQCVQELDP